MNKEKNAEIKGFLRWLEGEIGALSKNKKKLKEGYDPTRRAPREKLQAEFTSSIETKVYYCTCASSDNKKRFQAVFISA